ncbi:Uncharacterised protein [Actinobacillus equuli]|nr:Uncharacterised protein [Actinobacillus equuli]
MNLYSRQMKPLIEALIKQFPAVLVTGPRQVGKSTLLQYISEDYQYVTFDDPMVLSMAKNDPSLFMLNYSGKLILDEVQYAPELFSSLKLAIDKQKTSGLYLLSGSQAFHLMQNVTESLAGRVAVLKLQGFSLREIQQLDFRCLLFLRKIIFLPERKWCNPLKIFGKLFIKVICHACMSKKQIGKFTMLPTFPPILNEMFAHSRM